MPEPTGTAEITETYRPRVAFTSGSIQGVVTARKRHRCQNHLTDERHYIEPGDRYVANALPPGHSDIGNPGWWHLRVCLDCCPAEHDPRPTPPPQPDPEWRNDEGRNPRCLNVSCGERQDGRRGKWWDDYGTCCRSHAEDYYGEECIE